MDVLFELSIDDVTENLKLPMGMRAKAFVWFNPVFIDNAKISPFLETGVIVAG